MSAIISSCGKYRYLLERAITVETSPNSDKPVVWVMCNPSTADATKDDATIRKCKGFTRLYGRGRMIVVNVFAYRATNPRDLLKVSDPVGYENAIYLRSATSIPGAIVIAAWGEAVPRTMAGLTRECSTIIREGGATVMCFGITDARWMPRHPVRLSYSTPLVEYRG